MWTFMSINKTFLVIKICEDQSSVFLISFQYRTCTTYNIPKHVYVVTHVFMRFPVIVSSHNHWYDNIDNFICRQLPLPEITLKEKRSLCWYSEYHYLRLIQPLFSMMPQSNHFTFDKLLLLLLLLLANNANFSKT